MFYNYAREKIFFSIPQFKKISTAFAVLCGATMKQICKKCMKAFLGSFCSLIY